MRFWDLGYSHFYGDETKVFYLDKTIPAFEFFMNQRKGPVQFVAAWAVEKLTGDYSELYTRIPFALAGFLSVVVFYALAKKIFEAPAYKKYSQTIALISTTLFSFNGFNVAFSRTVQYQSFLTLFGLLTIYLFLNKKYLLSAVPLALAFLSHYDAVFFTIPLLYVVVDKKVDFKMIFVKFVLPLAVLVGIFYVPYIYHGYFATNTLNYIAGRFGGDPELARNYSAFTFIFYNPCLFPILFLLAPFALLFNRFKKAPDTKVGEDGRAVKMLVFWFLVSFIVFQFLITNPGTHVHNYLIPLYFLAGYSVVVIWSWLGSAKTRKFYSISVGLLLAFTAARVCYVYLPVFNSGYPWSVGSFNGVHARYQIFVYGFPYYRNWDEIRDYFESGVEGRVEGVFTNDNDTVAEFYLRGFNYTRPGTNFLPQYYIDVKNNQEFVEFKPVKDMTQEQFYLNYEEIKRFEDGAVIYKLKTL